MPAITIRNVPQEVRNELAARAARAGQSLQEYLRGQLVDLAERPTAADAIARIRAGLPLSGAPLDRDEIVADVHAARR